MYMSLSACIPKSLPFVVSSAAYAQYKYPGSKFGKDYYTSRQWQIFYHSPPGRWRKHSLSRRATLKTSVNSIDGCQDGLFCVKRWKIARRFLVQSRHAMRAWFQDLKGLNSGLWACWFERLDRMWRSWWRTGIWLGVLYFTVRSLEGIAT